MMQDDGFAGDEMFMKKVREALRELYPPPPTPREAMWARIEAARRGARQRAPGASRHRGWSRWGSALAASLVLGFVLGRGSLLDRTPTGPAIEDSSTAFPGLTLPYRLAAVNHLDAAEALLSALPEDARRGRTTHVAAWAADLLLATRLMLDSPAAEDPQMAALLEDLELVLAQVASLPRTPAEAELDIIEEGIRHNDVLLRVRAATNQRPVTGI